MVATFMTAGGGALTTLWPGRQGCLACVQRPPAGQTSAPLAAPLLGLLGTLQATEVLKVITGAGEPFAGRLLEIDLHTSTFTPRPLRRAAACPLCDGGPPPHTAR
jgi:molybdopterin/thiamine biosynthesis adenylyltransferase